MANAEQQQQAIIRPVELTMKSMVGQVNELVDQELSMVAAQATYSRADEYIKV